MKRINLFIVALAIIIGVGACKSTLPELGKRGTLSVSTQEIVIENDGGSKTIEVTASDGEWQLVPYKDEWLKNEIKGNSISLTIQPNKESNERTADLIIYAPKSKLTKVVTVKQFGISPALHVERDRVIFGKDGGDQNIKIVVNGSDWTVEDPLNASWLTVEKDEIGKAINLKATPVPKEAEDSGATRSTILVLSYGTSHSILNVRQDGWEYFPNIPINMNADRKDLIAHAQSQGYEQNNEYEKKYGRGNVVVFNTTALEGARVIYRYDDNNKKIEQIEIKAPDNKAFTEEKLTDWLASQGFTRSTETGKTLRGEMTEEYYYKEESEETTLVTVVNNSEAQYKLLDTKGAYMSFQKFSNQAVINNSKTGWLNFPVRNTSWLRNPKYKLEQVIEYEKQFGLEPNYTHGDTKKNDTGQYSDIQYKSVAFLPKDAQSNIPGTLRQVVYFFNIPGLKAEGTGKPEEFNSEDPKLAGTIARRGDVYHGDKWVVRALGTNYGVNPVVQRTAMRYGYVPAVFVDDLGLFYFTRGNEEDFMYIWATGGTAAIFFTKAEAWIKDYNEKKKKGIVK